MHLYIVIYVCVFVCVVPFDIYKSFLSDSKHKFLLTYVGVNIIIIIIIFLNK